MVILFGAPEVAHLVHQGLEPVVHRDGNGYPLPETRWVFAILGYGFGSISVPMGLLMGSNGNPTGTWAWVCSSTTIPANPWGFKTRLKINIPYKYVS
jgi:hypothetical protein